MQAKVLTEQKRRSQASKVSMHAVSRNERLVHYWGTAYDRPRPCTYCGRVHTKGRCPAYGRTCRACGRKNHFESCCRGMARVAPLHAINTEPEDFLMTVSTDTDLEEVNATSQMFPSRIFATMQLEGEPITFQLDCGATCNVVHRSDLPREARITSTNTCLKMYNGTTETPLAATRQMSTTPRIGKHTGCCSWWCNQHPRPYWEHRLAKRWTCSWFEQRTSHRQSCLELSKLKEAVWLPRWNWKIY